jgi:hypothetical protein
MRPITVGEADVVGLIHVGPVAPGSLVTLQQARFRMDPLRFHDFHLRGYTVSDFGTRIVLDLVYDYPDVNKDESRITFSDVAYYSFLHPSGAIITDIDEIDVAALVQEDAAFFTEIASQYGLRHWNDSAHGLEGYLSALRNEQMRAWRISSAIGFDGFVIAKSVSGQFTEHPTDGGDPASTPSAA